MAAVKDVNAAYGFKKDDQITMTFEGPDNEEDVESQINTLDAVIAENPSRCMPFCRGYGILPGTA